MAQLLLLAAIALVVAALVFGVGALLTGADPGLSPVEPDGVSRGLPGTRPLEEADFATARFDTAMRGYRMAQVDAAMARAAYDVGFKQELIDALRAEVDALRDGRISDADVLRKAREAASGDTATSAVEAPAGQQHATPSAHSPNTAQSPNSAQSASSAQSGNSKPVTEFAPAEGTGASAEEPESGKPADQLAAPE
jgi:DivIVA domain-containing protein